MLSVYKKLSAIKVDLKPEIRSVFDRMLATDEEIKLAEQARSMAPLFARADQAGMTLPEFVAYQSLGTEATQEAIEELQPRECEICNG